MRGLKKKQAAGRYVNQSILTESTPFNIKEAYKAARTNIMFSIAKEGCKKIAITSSYPGEGKTTMTTNLAITFAQTGAKVLIIDCDLRKSRIHNVLQLNTLQGLSHVLGGFCKIDGVIAKTQYENLDAIGVGHIPPNPAELLASEKMKNILEELEQGYDYIFLDTPPVNLVTDAAILGRIVDGTIVVTRYGVTTHGDLEDAIAKLNRADVKILGVALGSIKQEKCLGYGKYSKYGKYGKYSKYSSYEYSDHTRKTGSENE